MKRVKEKLLNRFSLLISGALVIFYSFPIQVFAGTEKNKTFANPIGGEKGEFLAASDIVGRVVSGLLSFTGVLALVTMVFAGVKIAMAQGNAEKRAAGIKAMVFAVVGLIITFLGFIILNTILTGKGVGGTGLIDTVIPGSK